MKKTTFIFFLLLTLSATAQYNRNAPWMKALGAKNGTATLEEMKASFDEYWKTHDANKKGVGYKPFMRWINHWENSRNQDGSLMTNSQLQEALNLKNNAILSRNAANITVSNWQPVGPQAYINTGSWSSGKGRVQCVAVDPSNANNIYIGTPASGIWKSTDAGVNFVNISDQLPQNGVSGIAVDPNNSNTIYIATGDSDSGDTFSSGVLKTIDGGTNWIQTGLNLNVDARDIIINPSNNQMIWCATANGVYKTTNGGTTWTNNLSGNFAQGALRLQPNNPNNIYAASDIGIYKSTDAGNTFAQLSNGLPTGIQKCLIDVSPADPSVLYALTYDGSNYLSISKSIDYGQTFVQMGTTNLSETNQVWYDMAFAVSSINANEIYSGTLNIWKSTDGGTTSSQLNSWSAPLSANYTHADIHYLKFIGSKLYCGSDGGIYMSNNQGVNFTDLSASAQIGQFYKIAVSKQTAGKMVGGLQDNGGFGYSNNQWKNYYGADGMDTAIDPNNSNLYYGFTQSGGSLHISSNAANSAGSSIPSPASENGNWVTPLVVNSIGEVFSGFTYLYKLNGTAWMQQSNSAVGVGNIDKLTIDPNNDNNVWVATNGKLYKSTNRGVSFSNVYNNTLDITSICVSASSSNTIYITTSGTTGQVLKSTNGGLLFLNISTGLPSIAKTCIKHQGRNTNNPIFVGTSLGVYYRDDTLSSWIPFSNNLPNVAVTDLEINLEDAKIVAATYGRGIWQSSIDVQVPATDLKLENIISPTTTVGCTAVNPVIAVKNTGSSTITSITVNYTINTTPYTYTWTGSLATMLSTNISLPTLNLSRGSYTIQVNATTTNDAYSDNNSLISNFYINNSGTVGVVNTFENTASELVTYSEGTNGGWVRGIRSGSALNTGTNNVYTSNLTGNYTDGKKAYLVSQCYDLTQMANPEIRFKMAYDLEPDYDVLFVQYTTDNGLNWSLLGAMGANWYNSNRTPINSVGDCQNCPGGQWTGTNTTLTEYFYPLNTLSSNNNIIFRIVFQSDESANQLGVIVDDFVINGTLATEQFDLKNCVIYPNPSTGIFNIGIGNTTINKIEIIDVLGKKIFSENEFPTDNSNIQIDLSSLNNGVYFIKIYADNQFVTKKIIKN